MAAKQSTDGERKDPANEPDLQRLIAAARDKPPAPPSESDDELVVDVPPSVREAIRMSDSLIPVVPPIAPRPAPGARRWATLAIVAAFVLGFVALARMATTPAPPPDLEHTLDLPARPALPADPPIDPPPAPAPRSTPPRAPIAPPRSLASPHPPRPRPTPSASSNAPPAPSTPPLMDAITDAVRRSGK